MKSLENLTNVEKAKLLHELFPQEIPTLLDFIHNMCLTIQEDEQLLRRKCDDGLLTIEAWLSLAEEVRIKIDRYKNRLHTHSRLFSDQLFDGYAALYIVHCIVSYTKAKKLDNHKFTLAVDLLFNP